jgi:hypothetical protein
MTQVVTVSATTAAYAAEAAKPSARLRGNGPADEAITLLSPRRTEATAAVAMPTAKTKGALALALMLMSAERRQPLESAAETLRRYLEYAQDEEMGERQEEGQDDTHVPEDPPDESLIEKEPGTDEIAAILDEFIQGG